MPRISLGFTGTRQGMTADQSRQFVRLARCFTGDFHAGDCIGSDDQATKTIERIGGYHIFIHPPVNPKFRANYKPRDKQQTFFVYPPKPYVERDLDIVVESDAMIATPTGTKEIRRGSGTWITIRMARAELRPLAIIYPDGRIDYERWPKDWRKV